MPLISVIIPAHNEENYILSTLDSLQQQNFLDFEIIVVANGCSDRTEEIVDKRTNNRLQLLRMAKANVSRARNHGASKAKSEVLVFLDADTTLDSEALEKINSSFSKIHAVATTRVKPNTNNHKFKLLTAIKNFNNYCGWYKGWISGVLICRKQDFDAVNGYDPLRKVREHRNLIIKLLKQGKYASIPIYATTSMRRFQQWGLLKAAVFWLKQLYLDNFGDITKSEYEKVR